MKRIVATITLALFVLSGLMLIFLFSAPKDAVVQPASAEEVEVQESSRLVPFGRFPLDEPVALELVLEEEVADRLTERERTDQALDWLLFTVLADSGLSVDELNESTFDIPTIRYGYLADFANFEYGETRSVHVGDGEVVALLPAGVSEKTRRDHLAYVADRQRNITGQIPDKVMPFAYELNMSELSGTISRMPAFSGDTLFTEESGYFETIITDAADLQSFLTNVDDITYGKQSSDGLLLGGRRLFSEEYLNIEMEDVAAIWQAHTKVQSEIKALNQRWSDRCSQPLMSFSAEQICRDYFSDPAAWGDRRFRVSDADWQRLEELIEGHALEQQGLAIVNGLGFSLDPVYDYESFAAFFASIEPGLEMLITDPSVSGSALACGELLRAFEVPFGAEESSQENAWQTDPEVLCSELSALAALAPVETVLDIPPSFLDNVREDLEERDESSFFELISVLESSSNLGLIFWGEVLFEAGDSYRIQAARYDGDLQGTEVGMTLFYTDLMAKLWALDFLQTAPQDDINGFVAYINRPIAEIYRYEPSRTRLWFGAQNKGFQIGGDNRDLYFDRVATRVYAASSDRLTPGQEVEANTSSQLYLGWWNDHYDEVSRYEPQYQRLNEIMKWSLLITWLEDQDQTAQLSFLAEIPVDHSDWFPEWAQANVNLRFQEWNQVTFFERGHLGLDTEVMPILYSEPFAQFPTEETEDHVLSGGVSLADLQVFDDVLALPAFADDLVAFRPGLTSFTDDLLLTVDDIAYCFNCINDWGISLAAYSDDAAYVGSRTNRVEVRPRSIDTEMTLQPIVRVTEPGVNSGLSVHTHVGTKELGALEITSSQNGFKVGWLSRDIDEAQQIALGMSQKASPMLSLDDFANVKTVLATADDESLFFQLEGSNTWFKTAVEESFEHVSVPSGWQARIAHPEAGTKRILLDWSDDALSNAASGKHLTMGSNNDVLSLSLRPSAGSRPITLRSQTGSLKIEASFDSSTGEMHFAWDSLDDMFKNNPDLLTEVVDPTEIDRLRQLASGTTEHIPKNRMLDHLELTRNMADDVDYPAIARQIAADPPGFWPILDDFCSITVKRVDDLLLRGQFTEAISQLDDLITLYGPRPDLTVRLGVAQMEVGNLTGAAQALEGGASLPLRHPASLFDEVNLQLNLSKSASQQQELYRIAQFADWQNLQNSQLVPQGAIGFTDDLSGIGLKYQMGDDLAGAPVALDDIVEGAPFYIQDSPGLNNLDWQPGSFNHSLQQAVSGDMGSVVRLPRGDISYFNPTKVYAPGNQTFNLAPTTGNPISVQYVPIFLQSEHCVFTPEVCGDDEDSDVFFLIANE